MIDGHAKPEAITTATRTGNRRLKMVTISHGIKLLRLANFWKITIKTLFCWYDISSSIRCVSWFCIHDAVRFLVSQVSLLLRFWSVRCSLLGFKQIEPWEENLFPVDSLHVFQLSPIQWNYSTNGRCKSCIQHTTQSEYYCAQKPHMHVIYACHPFHLCAHYAVHTHFDDNNNSPFFLHLLIC